MLRPTVHARPARGQPKRPGVTAGPWVRRGLGAGLHAQDEGLQVVLGARGLPPCRVCRVQLVQHPLAGLQTPPQRSVPAPDAVLPGPVLPCEAAEPIRLSVAHVCPPCTAATAEFILSNTPLAAPAGVHPICPPPPPPPPPPYTAQHVRPAGAAAGTRTRFRRGLGAGGLELTKTSGLRWAPALCCVPAQPGHIALPSRDPPHPSAPVTGSRQACLHAQVRGLALQQRCCLQGAPAGRVTALYVRASNPRSWPVELPSWSACREGNWPGSWDSVHP